MTDNSSNPDQSTIGEKLKALSHFGIFGQSLHVLRRDHMPSKFYVTNVAQKKWKEWIARVEQEYQWLPENRITWMDDHPLSFDERCYFLHLEHGITFRYDSENESIQMFYDHESNAKTVEQILSLRSVFYKVIWDHYASSFENSLRMKKISLSFWELKLRV